MPSARSEAMLSPTPVTSIDRPMSSIERYHAAIATHPGTLEIPRETVVVIEGRNALAPEQWQRALRQAAEANPGARMRLHGSGPWTHWRSDGPAPRLRVVENCTWDARSSEGAGFVQASSLPLKVGPVAELLLAQRGDGSALLALRAHHAVMDGMGNLHFLHEIFRALRGEPLLGSNALVSDTQLMRSLAVRESTSKHFPTCWLTGAPQGAERGDDWRRIGLGKPRKNQLALLAAAYAEFAHRSSDLPALIAVPVNLRRHAQGLRSTANFSSMMLVKLAQGEGAEIFRERLQQQLAGNMEAMYPAILELVRWLPLRWLDRMLSRTPKNYATRKPMETAVISNLGRFDTVPVSAPGFEPQGAFLVPLPGSAFSILNCINDQVELTLNLPRVLSGDGRFDALEAFLRERFAD